MTTDLATREPQVLAPNDPALPSPMFRGAHMVRALADYRELQKALDESMPDQLMTLDGKPFRKKGYWRAIAVAFNLTVEPVTDAAAERSVIGALDDGSENYVYTVAYRATAPNGRSAIGDGTCAAMEKQRGRMKATEHNVRSHAHTRAFNRAVSNLVGFGEVSAEEVDRDEHHSETPATMPVRADGSALVTAVDTKTGRAQNGKPWTMYLVTFDDGRSGSTFDTTLATQATTAKDAGTPVLPTLEQKGQYWNLVALAPVAPAGSAPAANNGHDGATISENQQKRLRAIAEGQGWTAEDVLALLATGGLDSVAAIPKSDYEAIINAIKRERKAA